MPQTSLNTGSLCTAVTFLRGRVRAISKASRATRRAPRRVITRVPMVISSFGRNSPAAGASDAGRLHSLVHLAHEHDIHVFMHRWEIRVRLDRPYGGKQLEAFLRTGGIIQVASLRG